MIVSLELPYGGGLVAAKAFLNEIKLSPVNNRPGWPELWDVFMTDTRYEPTFIELIYNEVQEPFLFLELVRLRLTG